jgi:iron(III) transport system ATP-binding protein/putative spermidine/putrescine transport system ATP-binding protein|tara:strand:- start:509 stop:1606 length:1098 start_codon:yes stop_codon:yes gene_type:complete
MSNVSIRSVQKHYGAFHAVKGVDLEVEDGEFVVLLGPSGCGKTTTLRCVAGLEEISGGSIVMGDEVMSSASFSVPPEKRDIGMVFQSYAIWPHMSVAENTAFGLKIKKMSAGVIEQKVKAALDRVGLSKFADRGASQLSGGQQQRVALARAIALEPGVLLFDEPLSNLDAKLRERMRFELRQLLQGLGITSIYVTHDQQEAMVVADRIVLMNEGQIDQIGSPTDIYYRPKTMFGAEFVGLANKLRGTLVANGSHSRIRLDNGEHILAGATDRSVGSSVDLVIRPEMLQLAATELSGDNVFRGKADVTYFLGNIGDIYFNAAGHQLRGQLSPPMPWQPGQDIWVRIDPASVLIYPATEKASTAKAA